MAPARGHLFAARHAFGCSSSRSVRMRYSVRVAPPLSGRGSIVASAANREPNPEWPPPRTPPDRCSSTAHRLSPPRSRHPLPGHDVSVPEDVASTRSHSHSESWAEHARRRRTSARSAASVTRPSAHRSRSRDVALCESFLSAEQGRQMEPFFPRRTFVCEQCYPVSSNLSYRATRSFRSTRTSPPTAWSGVLGSSFPFRPRRSGLSSLDSLVVRRRLGKRWRDGRWLSCLLAVLVGVGCLMTGIDVFAGSRESCC